MNKKKLITSNLSIELKNRIVKSVLWNMMLYASETRSLSQVDRKRERSHGKVDLEKNGDKNSSRDEIANVNFCTTTTYM